MFLGFQCFSVYNVGVSIFITLLDFEAAECCYGKRAMERAMGSVPKGQERGKSCCRNLKLQQPKARPISVAGEVPCQVPWHLAWLPPSLGAQQTWIDHVVILHVFKCPTF